jgi:bifunctional enzyme CysN/CysC
VRAISETSASVNIAKSNAMSETPKAAPEVREFLARHEQKELLRFVAVGSVDDGKSTLIGRLLHDTSAVYDDQVSAVRRASKQGGEIDFSLFTDGLKAEREQGITIDVAYRYFSTDRRKFIIADTPGHVQYTRNMATGASTADVGIILIDARLGILPQSRRHAYIASLLGIPELTVCVNKMDLVGFDREAFERIRDAFAPFLDKLGFSGRRFIPVSALLGDNVVEPSKHALWYRGPTLLEHLETVRLSELGGGGAFRYPVQYVLRPSPDYRAYAGQVAAGAVRVGDRVMVLPTGRVTEVTAIDTFDGPLDGARAPQSVAVRLRDEIDVSRGDMLVEPLDPPRDDRHFEAMLVWMSERPLDPERSYFLRHTTQCVRAEVERVEHVVDLETLEPVSAEHLELNDIGRVTIACHRRIFWDPYRKNRATGAFVLVDAISNDTVAAGMIIGPAAGPPFRDRTAAPRTQVSALERRDRLRQSGATVWLTGLPASGKSSVAWALERLLFDRGKVCAVVDPDDGETRELGPGGSSPPHAPELARRFADAGVIAIFAFESPRASERRAVGAAVGAERFIEVHVATPVDACRRRDTRGRYDLAHQAPGHEPPESPALCVSTESDSPELLAERIYDELERRKLV